MITKQIFIQFKTLDGAIITAPIDSLGFTHSPKGRFFVWEGGADLRNEDESWEVTEGDYKTIIVQLRAGGNICTI